MIAVQLVARAASDADPLFSLEPGPIAPIDPATFITPMPRPALVPLVASTLEPTGGLHATIDAGHQTITENSDPTRITAASTGSLEPGAEAHAAHEAAYGTGDPSSVLATAGSHDALIAQHSGVYDAPPPSSPYPPIPVDTPGTGGPPQI